MNMQAITYGADVVTVFEDMIIALNVIIIILREIR